MRIGTKTGGGSRRFAVPMLATLAAALLAAAVLAACGDDQPAAPTGDPSITGVVASAMPVDGGATVGSFLIDRGTGDYDKASVAVNADTGWYRRGGDGFEAIDAPTADELTGKTVLMSETVDPAVLGGMVVKVGSTVYDGSVRTQLSKIQENIEKG